jgi:hypothetical protein
MSHYNEDGPMEGSVRSSTKRQLEIPEACQRLCSTISELGNLVGQLEERLYPVMRLDDRDVEVEGEVPLREPMPARIADQIQNEADRVHVLCKSVAVILARLSV